MVDVFLLACCQGEIYTVSNSIVYFINETGYATYSNSLTGLDQAIFLNRLAEQSCCILYLYDTLVIILFEFI